ncbi:MarR family transcriptional regulator [Hansschlegelia zhihuaiae]|nr:MarR family transcriptional regulator [Hansschlegelia zhihuaiae]
MIQPATLAEQRTSEEVRVHEILCASGHWCSAYIIASRLGLSRAAVSRAMQRMKRRGLVEADGHCWRALTPRELGLDQ